MFRLVVLCGCLMTVANGGLIGTSLLGTSGPAAIALQPSAAAVALQQSAVGIPSVASTSSNIIRGIGNIGAISAYSKSVDTAFSSERKADVRINNPDVQTGVLSTVSAIPTAATLSYAATAPALHAGGVALAAGPGLTTTLTGAGLATSGLGLGLNGVAVNGLVNGYGLGVNGYGIGLNGYGLQTVNGLGLHGVKVL
ncbi:pupal cuticle protein C1B-like [Athalia rosae]|uniref:pupal cuticle protein C1B-like n=1 Tax=Athalia rosae TaxID=37344 RepID=UPI0006253102|nr:pupal cuticle protein C1B-like [Athalia rosae]